MDLFKSPEDRAADEIAWLKKKGWERNAPSSTQKDFSSYVHKEYEKSQHGFFYYIIMPVAFVIGSIMMLKGPPNTEKSTSTTNLGHGCGRGCRGCLFALGLLLLAGLLLAIFFGPIVGDILSDLFM